MENFNTCKECKSEISETDIQISKDICFVCRFKDIEIKPRPKPIWPETKKMYQGGRL